MTTRLAVHRQVTVRRPVDVTFRIFVEETTRWWPLAEGYSWGADRYQDVVIEPRAGGRLYERFRDGEEYDIGTVLVYEPPHRLVFTWTNPKWEAPTEIEVRFTGDGGGTRVEVEHRGFEGIGPLAERARDGYDSGWPTVLARFAAYAHRTVDGLGPDGD